MGENSKEAASPTPVWGICLIWTLVTLVFILPVLISILVFFSQLSSDGTITGIEHLENGRVRAAWALEWTLWIPLIGSVTCPTDSVRAFNPVPHTMGTSVRVPNPTPMSIHLHPTNISVIGPEVQSHSTLADMWTPDVYFTPGFSHNTDFETWINIHSLDRAEYVVTRVLASGSGGDMTLKMNPHITLLWISNTWLFVAKRLHCDVTPIEVKYIWTALGVKRLRRVGIYYQYGSPEVGSTVTDAQLKQFSEEEVGVNDYVKHGFVIPESEGPQSVSGPAKSALLSLRRERAGSLRRDGKMDVAHGHGGDVRSKYRNVHMSCSYLGNAWPF